MSDNPKSLASLADDLERLADGPGFNGYASSGQGDLLREAAAALRAPTIAAVTDEMVDAALTEYVGEPPFEDYFGEEGVGPHRLNMRAALEAALATPSPTIADRLRETDADNAVTVTLLRDAAGWIEMLAYSEACATAADTIERQGKALRAVEALCFQREQMMAGEPNPAFAAQLTTSEIRAALAQTEPQP